MNFVKRFLLLCFLVSGLDAQAQTYGNEWIDYGQNYYQFQVYQDGIYRLDYAALNNAGIPLTLFQSDNIQLFGKEREIPIHIEDGGDNSMDPGDYILFYAQKNDGWLDSLLYEDPNRIGNAFYSLYNDTLNYFFTWNSSTNNNRFIVETDVNFGNYSSIEDYIICTSKFFANSYYMEGEKTSIASSSMFTPGEGWGTIRLNGTDQVNYLPQVMNIATPSPYLATDAPDVKFQGRSVSASDAAVTGTFNHHMKWYMGSSNTEIYDTVWKGYGQTYCNVTFSPTLLSNGNTPVTHAIIDDLNVLTDYQSIQSALIEYARIPNMNGANALNFRVKNNPQGKIRVDFSNSGTSNSIALVFGEFPRMVPFAVNGSSYSGLIPNTSNGSEQTVILKDASSIIDIVNLSPVNGTGVFTNFANEPLDAAYLMICHPSLESASAEYEAYRDLTFNAYRANVEELYLQFGGGIQKHIFGIRRFVHFVYNTTTDKPVALFLVGKGVREASINEHLFDGPGTRQSTDRFQQSLIPSYGQPSSDNAITSNLVGTLEWVPLIPTGRISAQTDQELRDYLTKVEAYELNQNQNDIYDTPNKDWQKQVIHFAGGSNATEHTIFQGYMNNMSNKISDSLFGANVTKIYKTDSNPLNPTILGAVTDRISQGVSLMSYYGHANTGSASGFEINLDDPINWDNEGKYPVMFVNSCYNGNLFQASTSKSEEFVQIPKFGAIAYIASVNLGITTYLDQYSQQFYNQISNINYGKPLGEILQKNSSYLEQFFSGYGLNLETTCMQMTLNGDPMLKLNWHTKPEIELTPDDVSFSPTLLDWTVDSIQMQIVLTNLGISVTDTFQVQVTRHFPQSNIDSIYNFYIPKLDYTDTLRFKMPLQANIALGQNIFTVKIDLPSFIEEQYDEVNNNQLVVPFLINIDGIQPIIPYQFAVVPEDSVVVKASTINPIAAYNSYRFEIDTVDFVGTVPQSNQYRYAIVNGTGGVKEVLPSQWLSVNTNSSLPLVCEDSAVYFWRVQVVGDSIWRESSFQYIPGKTGWGQDHFYQFKNNTFFNLAYDRPTRELNYAPSIKELECNVNSSNSSSMWFDNAYFIDGVYQTGGLGVFTTPKVHVAVIDPVTLQPWTTGAGLNCYGNYNCNQGAGWKDFHFRQNDPAEMDSFQNFVLNVVPDSAYMLIYTPRLTMHSLWVTMDSLGIYSTFEALGSDSIRSNLQDTPFAFFVKKGDLNSVIEGYVPGTQGQGQTFQIKVDLVGADTYGREDGPLIGPASNWGNVYWKQNAQEVPTEDSTILYITAYDASGVPQTSLNQIFTPNDSLINLNSLIDASLYPFISLRADLIDSTDNTPAQLDRWHVLFTPLPEAAIDGSDNFYWSAGTEPIYEGQTIEFAIDVKNIFNIDMDSLLVSYWVENENHVKIPLTYARQDSLRVSQTLLDTISFSTVGMGGANSFWMEVNPYINGSFVITDQPEQEHFNNLLQIPFIVIEDDEHPILDVTFNGNHILNGDIIDPYSEILITLKDDNPFLIMDDIADTSLFGVYLTDPTGVQKRIPFEDASSATVMQWVPANAQNLRFKIIWPAAFELDGKYTLSVQGSDKSGNLSGDLDYKIDFEIIHESTITAMMNYPNPFSTSTRFVFTLTGSEVPDDILIQILTVSGRVVREISEDELGPIQIGRNVTEFSWNGTDNFGDPLANGVYLYRVITKLNGEDIKHRESGADPYFTKNFGKMYLLR